MHFRLLTTSVLPCFGLSSLRLRMSFVFRGVGAEAAHQCPVLKNNPMIVTLSTPGGSKVYSYLRQYLMESLIVVLL